MRKGPNGIKVLLVVVLVLVGGVVVWRRSHRLPPPHADGTTDVAPADDRDRRWKGFAAQDPTIVYPAAPPAERRFPAVPGSDAGPPPAPGGIVDEALMDRWRHGILEKNSDVVLELDAMFAAEPARFAPQLEIVAGSDHDDRVRAFSTRVLGKYKNVAAVGVFRRLMSDRSPYVRQNAAWAVGELAERPQGRQAAQDAVGDLHQLQESDPTPDVRAAADAALKKLQ